MTKCSGKEWIKRAGIRAIWTFAETMLGCITVGQAISEITWLHAISVSTVAAIVSLLKSIAGLPELKNVSKPIGDIIVDPETSNAYLRLDNDNVKPGDSVTLNVIASQNEGDEG